MADHDVMRGMAWDCREQVQTAADPARRDLLIELADREDEDRISTRPSRP